MKISDDLDHVGSDWEPGKPFERGDRVGGGIGAVGEPWRCKKCGYTFSDHLHSGLMSPQYICPRPSDFIEMPPTPPKEKP